ncbi:MAG: hypothetical protein U9R79_05375 [Armatimonadota bacterium]|nr:hypothetical protein [Armatimonadota bacterium]
MKLTRIVLALTLVALMTACAWGQEGLVPLSGRPLGPYGGESYLRGSFQLILYQRPGAEPLRLHVQARQVGRYVDEIVASHAGQVVRLAPGEEGELALNVGPGPVEVRLETGQNAAAVSCNGPVAVPASAERPASFISRVGRLFFYVPRGTGSFTVSVRGQGSEENATLTVFDPEGQEAGSATTIGMEGAELHVEVPQGHAGAAWSLTAGKAETGVFEDCDIGLSRDVPQYLSLGGDGVLVPFATGLRQPPRYVGTQEQPVVRLGLTAPTEEGRLVGTLRYLGTPRSSKTFEAPAAEGELEVALSGPRFAEYELRLDLKTPDMPGGVTARTPIARQGSILFVGGYQPLVSAESVARGDGRPTGVSVSLALSEPPPGLELRTTLLRSPPSHTPGGAGAETVHAQIISDWDGSVAILHPPEELPDGAYEWQAVLEDGSPVPLGWTRVDFVRWNDQHFTDVTAQPPTPLGATVPAHASQGWIPFVPEAAEAIPYRYRPSAEDVERRIELIATPGEYEPATVGVLATAATRGLRVTASELTTAAGERIPAEAWEVRWARYWSQRISWRSTTFHVIPEMLERRPTVDLAPLQPAQAWLTLHVPEDARPGRYHGTVRITDADGGSAERRVIVDVQPFRLMATPEYHWGLYTDSSRWRRMPERQVRAEMRDFVAHGITSAMMYPPDHSEISLEDGEARIDSAEFERYMRWALQEGLRPPTVISMQALAGTVKGLLPEAEVRGPQFERVYKQIVQHFAEVGEREGWGELFWHAVDEPNRGHPDRAAAAYEELSWFKDLGLSTFTTVNDPVTVEEELNPVLDARTYYVHFVVGSAEAQQLRAQETADSGDHLWMYGTGCYTGMDGATMPNRYLAGYMLAKSGAEGIWCWTLQRAKGDIYNDFDGEEQREAKEACTTYVSEDGTEMVPTLQWEGHREGVDDFRYIYTLQQMAEAEGEAGRRALEELDALLAEVPWGVRPQDFTAADANEVRREVASLIRSLQAE